MLRAKLFVDLYSVVRHGIRASVESYSIKKLEPFYGCVRSTSLHDANLALVQVQACMELNNPLAITDDAKAKVTSYNQDDCLSTLELRDWRKREFRTELVAWGT